MGAFAPTPQLLALQKLGLSEDEIADVIATDKEIDKGAKLFELAPELQAGAKKARQADRTDTPKPRERKPNEDKRILLEQLANAIGGSPIHAQCEITNQEREFLFIYNGIKYKVTLSAPRK
jgi:hypothetical protein